MNEFFQKLWSMNGVKSVWSILLIDFNRECSCAPRDNKTLLSTQDDQLRLDFRAGWVNFENQLWFRKSWLCKFNQTNKKRKKNLVAQAVRSLTNLVGSNSSLFSLEAMSEGEHQNIPSSLCEHERQHGEPQLLPVTSSQTWTQPSGIRKGSSKNVP